MRYVLIVSLLMIEGCTRYHGTIEEQAIEICGQAGGILKLDHGHYAGCEKMEVIIHNEQAR